MTRTNEQRLADVIESLREMGEPLTDANIETMLAIDYEFDALLGVNTAPRAN